MMMVQHHGGIDGGNALCFEAVEASTLQLNKYGSPQANNLEILKSNGGAWEDYSFGDTISLAAGQKVWMRNKSETQRRFSLGAANNYYYFVMTGTIKASGDITSLLKKDCTDTLSTYCFVRLFYDCSSLVQAPDINVAALPDRAFHYTFYQTSINYIKCLATDIPDGSHDYWLQRVPSGGTFVKHPDATWTTGTSGIPSTWTIINADI